MPVRHGGACAGISKLCAELEIDKNAFLEQISKVKRRDRRENIKKETLSLIHISTTFEKVDQTFIIDWQINLLNHNSPQLLKNNRLFGDVYKRQPFNIDKILTIIIF